MSSAHRTELLTRGLALMERFCVVNGIAAPLVEHLTGTPTFGACAYYRDGVIAIWPNSCAAIGTAGRAWSYPGHSIDRTPYGVLQHELGHHVDRAHGARPGLNGFYRWRMDTGEKPLTGYCPNDNEWFAEMFRLFVTNPDLLRLLRPRTYALMVARWLTVETRTWDVVLAGAARQLAVIRKRLPAPAAALASEVPADLQVRELPEVRA